MRYAFYDIHCENPGILDIACSSRDQLDKLVKNLETGSKSCKMYQKLKIKQEFFRMSTYNII